MSFEPELNDQGPLDLRYYYLSRSVLTRTGDALLLSPGADYHPFEPAVVVRRNSSDSSSLTKVETLVSLVTVLWTFNRLNYETTFRPYWEAFPTGLEPSKRVFAFVDALIKLSSSVESPYLQDSHNLALANLYDPHGVVPCTTQNAWVEDDDGGLTRLGPKVAVHMSRAAFFGLLKSGIILKVRLRCRASWFVERLNVPLRMLLIFIADAMWIIKTLFDLEGILLIRASI